MTNLKRSQWTAFDCFVELIAPLVRPLSNGVSSEEFIEKPFLKRSLLVNAVSVCPKCLS